MRTPQISHNAPESDADMELTLELPMPSNEAQGGALLADLLTIPLSLPCDLTRIAKNAAD